VLGEEAEHQQQGSSAQHLGHCRPGDLQCDRSDVLQRCRRYEYADLGAILVYDITVKESFDKVNYWLSQLKKFAPKDIVILIVGNKIDKESERKISKDQLVKFCDQQKVMYEEASAKEDLGVSQLFRNIAVGMLTLNRNRQSNR
jgi:GTPase SAR1 family protein